MTESSSQLSPVLLNPGGGTFTIDDVDEFLEAAHARGEEPMVEIEGDIFQLGWLVDRPSTAGEPDE